ncbi:MAG TPA: dihydroorotate dehydrogenase-like protein [Candidatus Sulfotelmatobacter sp.]|jgi:dihydroorotate dehydrogenase (fumarate)|nr:dihydroorotate dehydrogenase-like protein [Candidatus Sulfotelmatobacter sp.]
MIDLSTTYLGLKLRSPLVASASPLSRDIEGICRLEDAGASAVVLYSLFEEQLRQEEADLDYHMAAGTESFAESITYFPQPSEFHTGPEGYLKHISKAKKAVGIPIIASLNGSTLGGWTKFAGQIERAGADAIECNIYFIPTDPKLTAEDVEKTYLDILKAVKSTVTIPVAVKLSPFFSNMANMAHRLDEAGADALVLFNRFYQPDIDLEELAIRPNVLLSTPQALRLPLTWIGILHGRVKAGLAATGGVHGADDVIKLLMVGANVTMLCSSLMRHGINHLRHVERELREWMEAHEYESVAQMQGSMSQIKCPDPGAFERAQYMRAVKGLQHLHIAGWQ